VTAGGEFRVRAEDRAAFDRDGVICLRNVLSLAEVEALRGAVGAQLDSLGTSATGYDFETLARAAWEPGGVINAGAASRFDMAGLKHLLSADPSARPLLEADASPETGLFFYDAAGWRQDGRIRDVAFFSPLPEIAGELLRARQVQFWEDTTFVKAPHTRQKTAFHQDLGYFQISGDQCGVAWVPLDPAGPWNGVTQYVRGSHRWGKVYAPNIFLSQTPFPGADGPRCPDIEADPAAWDIVSFEIAPGDVIFHHVLTVHGAGGNTSAHWRRAMSFRYCGEEVRFLDRPGAGTATVCLRTCSRWSGKDPEVRAGC
jgi:hypothetical protein